MICGAMKNRRYFGEELTMP